MLKRGTMRHANPWGWGHKIGWSSFVRKRRHSSLGNFACRTSRLAGQGPLTKGLMLSGTACQRGPRPPRRSNYVLTHAWRNTGPPSPILIAPTVLIAPHVLRALSCMAQERRVSMHKKLEHTYGPSGQFSSSGIFEVVSPCKNSAYWWVISGRLHGSAVKQRSTWNPSASRTS